MNFGISKVCFLVMVCGSVAMSAAAEPLPLKRAMLSTGGVGYFEHETVVEGDAELDLEVRFDQVDDVLKSIVVYDDKGGVGAIALPGREPLAQVFRDLPFGQDALESPIKLLNALQGTELEVSGQSQLTGRLVRVVPETVVLDDGKGTTTRHRVSLMTVGGIRQFILEQADSVRLLDTQVRSQVDDALAAVARHRARDKRTLRITSTGRGARTVVVGYVVGSPLWKTTYRLTVDTDIEQQRGALQGWAVLENMSGHDWKDVELTLVSGNPVTLRQALYSAYYVDRPSVPVEVLGRVLPSPDRGVLQQAAPAVAERRELGGRAKSRFFGAQMEDMQADEPAAVAEAVAPASPPVAATPQLAQSQEAATQVLFRFPQPVNVDSGHSLVVPIANREFPAVRLSLYQPFTHDTHPLATIRLTNDGESGLPPGVFTLYERDDQRAVAYVGDARLNTLPAGDERLISFAVDQKTRISKEAKSTRTVSTAAIERRVMRLTTLRRQSTTYRIRGPVRENRRLLIEHPRQSDWKLVAPPEDEVELTDSVYRIGITIGKDEEKALEVVMERPVVEQVRIDSLPLRTMLAYAKSTELTQPVRRAFAKMADLQRALDAARSGVDDLEERRAAIFSDQERIRENARRVSQNSDLYRRYMKKLDTQETELEDLNERLEQAQDRVEQAEKALADYIAGLKV